MVNWKLVSNGIFIFAAYYLLSAISTFSTAWNYRTSVGLFSISNILLILSELIIPLALIIIAIGLRKDFVK